MLSDLIKLRNTKQPKSADNIDMLQYDYKFWTELEKVVKKQREGSLDVLKKAATNPTTPGIIMQSKRYKTVLIQTEPVRTFDKEVFIAAIIAEFKLDRAKVRQLATEAVVEGNRRNTYSVQDNA